MTIPSMPNSEQCLTKFDPILINHGYRLLWIAILRRAVLDKDLAFLSHPTVLEINELIDISAIAYTECFDRTFKLEGEK